MPTLLAAFSRKLMGTFEVRGYLFYCKPEDCGAIYGLTFLSRQPDTRAKCVSCGRSFPVTTDGKWVHYQVVGPEVLLAPDASV